jgi:integrase/recombinase XerD
MAKKAVTRKRAPKVPSLTPISDNGAWRVTVPPSKSATGKKQRLKFSTKKAAELEIERIKSTATKWGTVGTKISAALAEDAAKAASILDGYDITLAALAQAYVEAEAERSRSKCFADVWTFFEDSRELKSDDHKRTLANLGRKLNPHIGKKLVSEIKHNQLRQALQKEYKSAHGFNLALRSVSPAFNLAIREGWLRENPCKRIEKIDTGRSGEVSVLTLNQCRKLLTACRDYREDDALHQNYRVNASDALPAVALMLFAGVRPTETTRLDWEQIDIEEGTVFVSNQKAKTDRSRFFEMPETLKEWLKLTPAEDRIGSVCPANWKRKIQAIRQKTGISDARDQLRKTFATMHLAHFGDVNLTRSIIGHEHGDVLFTNYRAATKPKIAAEFWEIRPTANSLQAVG